MEQYKHWETGLISTDFESDTDRLKGKEGFPLEAMKIATDKSFKTWTQDAAAQDCEYRVIKMLERSLSNEVATIISGYKEHCLADIVKCINSDMRISDSEFDVLVILKVCRIMYYVSSKKII